MNKRKCTPESCRPYERFPIEYKGHRHIYLVDGVPCVESSSFVQGSIQLTRNPRTFVSPVTNEGDIAFLHAAINKTIDTKAKLDEAWKQIQLERQLQRERAESRRAAKMDSIKDLPIAVRAAIHCFHKGIAFSFGNPSKSGTNVFRITGMEGLFYRRDLKDKKRIGRIRAIDATKKGVSWFIQLSEEDCDSFLMELGGVQERNEDMRKARGHV